MCSVCSIPLFSSLFKPWSSFVPGPFKCFVNIRSSLQPMSADLCLIVWACFWGVKAKDWKHSNTEQWLWHAFAILTLCPFVFLTFICYVFEFLPHQVKQKMKINSEYDNSFFVLQDKDFTTLFHTFTHRPLACQAKPSQIGAKRQS